jgi:hypothetical protein|tara:strand:- start:7830 stop:8372 length:543 start_codon:yes stop_codon:yes gene_type:complete
MDQNYVENITKAGRSIPGQSLVNDPEVRYEFEKAPEITNLREGIEYFFTKIIDEETYPEVMELVIEGVPVMEIVQTILFAAFDKGIWNPDLMMLLAEPATYIIMGLAERAGIDYVIYAEEEEEEEAENVATGRTVDMAAYMKNKHQNIPKGAIPEEIQEKIEALPVESLMAPKEKNLLEE